MKRRSAAFRPRSTAPNYPPGRGRGSCSAPQKRRRAKARLGAEPPRRREGRVYCQARLLAGQAHGESHRMLKRHPKLRSRCRARRD
jgi:hypothetical protein